MFDEYSMTAPRHSRRITWFLLMVLVVAVAVGTVNSAGAAPLPDTGEQPQQAGEARGAIAFQSQSAIFVMDGDGRAVRRMTFDSFDNRHPSYCAENGQVVFSSNRDGETYQVYVMKDFGIEIVGMPTERLTSDEAINYASPAWSPDCRFVVMDANDGSTNRLYLYEMATGEGRYLGDFEGNAYRARWSPDGTQVAFHANLDGDFEIYTLNVESDALRNVTEAEGLDAGVSWSPDGTRLAFASNRDGNFEIYMLDLAVGTTTRLTDDPAEDALPVWAPDGNSLAFSSDRAGDYDIYLLSAEDGEVQTLYERAGSVDAIFSWDANTGSR